MARSNNATDTQNRKIPNIRRRLRLGNDFAIRAPSGASKTIGSNIAASGASWISPSDGPGTGRDREVHRLVRRPAERLGEEAQHRHHDDATADPEQPGDEPRGDPGRDEERDRV